MCVSARRSSFSCCSVQGSSFFLFLLELHFYLVMQTVCLLGMGQNVSVCACLPLWREPEEAGHRLCGEAWCGLDCKECCSSLCKHTSCFGIKIRGRLNHKGRRKEQWRSLSVVVYYVLTKSFCSCFFTFCFLYRDDMNFLVRQCNMNFNLHNLCFVYFLLLLLFF